MRRRLLVVTYRPFDFGGGGSARWRYFAEALPALGWDVTVVASGGPKVGGNESATDARSQRVSRVRARVMEGAGRIMRPACHLVGIEPEALAPSLAWAWTGRRTVDDAITRSDPDVVLATGPPIAAVLAASRVARTRDLPFVAEFRDLWAGNPYYDAGSRVLSAVEDRALRDAARVVSVTEGCRDRFLTHHPELRDRFLLVPNGFDPALLERRDTPARLDDSLTIIHAGGLYGDRTAVALLAAAGTLRLRDKLRVQLVGPIDAASLRAVEEARGAGLDVEVHPPVAWTSAIDMLVAADIAVVINSPGTGGDMALPGKLFEALAVGRPILALTAQNSDTARLLDTLGGGVVAAPDDIDGIRRALSDLVESTPTPVSAERLRPWSRLEIARRFAGELDELAPRSYG